MLLQPCALSACYMAEDGGGEKARPGVVEHYRLESGTLPWTIAYPMIDIERGI